MLFKIIEKENYLKCIKLVQKSYWPFGLNEKDTFRKGIITSPEDSVEEIDRKVEKRISELVGEQKKAGSYYVFDNLKKKSENVGYVEENVEYIENLKHDGEKVNVNVNSDIISFKRLRFPFVKEYHKYFFKRKFYHPSQVTIPLAMSNLLKNSNYNYNLYNYSKHYQNYIHFINVVAALAHLINFFSDEENLKKLGIQNYEDFKFPGKPNERTFQLMLAGYYHDIGKTVVDHRHSMEGETLIKYVRANNIAHFNNLGYEYNLNLFTREDIWYISSLVSFHDSFGMLSTGECSYKDLVNIIEKFQSFSANSNYTTIQRLFDLWILNVADTMVSLEKKFDIKEFVNNEFGGTNRLFDFLFVNPNPLSKSKGELLIQDLRIMIDLYSQIASNALYSNTIVLNSSLQRLAEGSIIERLRRLVKNSINSKEIETYCETIVIEIQKRSDNNVFCNINEEMFGIFKRQINNISDMEIDFSIREVINSTNNFQEYSQKFPLIGTLDYSLGFFQKISKNAWQKVCQEFIDPSYIRTGWIHDLKSTYMQSLGLENIDDMYYIINSKYFVDNYVATIVEIINHLLMRIKSNENHVNFEFSDATSRLTEEKLNNICSLKGPYRTHNSMELILSRVFMY